MDLIRIEAYAKINLGLKVLGKRPDGYHEIDTTFQSISLADQLEFGPRDDGEFHIKHKSITEIPLEENLVYKAYLLLKEKTGFVQGVSVRLIKGIPLSSGLGGGSSDAAATLVGINRLFDLNVSGEDLMAMAARLGSDVPFFLMGGRCRATGRGEDLTRLPFQGKSKFVVLFLPDFSLSTKEVYAAYDALPEQEPNYLRSPYENDLERAAMMVCLELAGFSKQLAAVCLSSWMSGSGATFYTLQKDAWRALAVAKHAEQVLPCKTQICRFTEVGHRILS